MRIHCLENVEKALRFLREQRVHLENVGSHDIVDGNPRLTLGLVWTIILRFQVGPRAGISNPGVGNGAGEAAGTRPGVILGGSEPTLGCLCLSWTCPGVFEVILDPPWGVCTCPRTPLGCLGSSWTYPGVILGGPEPTLGCLCPAWTCPGVFGVISGGPEPTLGVWVWS